MIPNPYEPADLARRYNALPPMSLSAAAERLGISRYTLAGALTKTGTPRKVAPPAHDYRGADNRLVDAYAALPKMSLEKAAQILGTSSRRLDNALTRTGYRRAAQEPQPAAKPVRASLFPLPAGSELSWSLLWQGLSGGVPPYPG